jgi:nicotinic acid phosphoribosyltransferase
MQAVTFGMGGGLLQKVNRDTLSFATKLSHIMYADGRAADIMKSPKGDASKDSLPGARSRCVRHSVRALLAHACHVRLSRGACRLR